MTLRNIGPAGIPNLGLGTFRMKEGEARDIVAAALAEGYRHIDTAQTYENEQEVGQALNAADVARDKVFVTTKILPKDFTAADFRKATEASLKALNTDYIDLLLLHWPSREVPLAETLPVLDALIDEGKVRFGGVSNFTTAQLEETARILKAPIAANQVELHPFIDQSRLLPFMQARDIPVEAYAPLAVGEVMQDTTLKDIAAAHGTSAAAVSVAWILSKPLGVAIPKTAKKERLAQNLGFADLTLTAEDIARIDALSRPDGRMVAPDGLAPDWD